ncbi:unnamed protein product [Cuscuta epithymum]|uniref:Protein kinase domain-containing protein n=1 Tax=Cuscuta epithymum TaxID=186058 RepID=A0AAV0FHY7_9ASTE|nr:unnamed protein product [Cuscuta epithymum]
MLAGKCFTHQIFLMKACSTYKLLYFLFVIITTTIIPLAHGDIKSDEEALLAFAASIHHGRKINWNSGIPICSSWVGINCSRDGAHVVTVRLPGVGLTGEIPQNTLGKLNGLRVLSLRSNVIYGTLPSDLTSLPELRNLFLQHNNLSGQIPTFPKQLSILDLSYNSFSGTIPPSVIQNLTHLTALNLQNNSLSGPIPNITLPRLKHLNLSYNHLNGSIPSSLQKFPKSSFLGNSFLCGLPLRTPCSSPLRPPPLSPPNTHLPHGPKERGHRKKFIIIIAVAACGTAVIFIVALLILMNRKKSEGRGVLKGKPSGGGRSEKPSEEFGSGVQEAEKNKLVFFEGCSYNFDLEDLLRASAEVLGKGSYGTGYKAILEESITVVVKRLKEVIVGKKEFEQQMEIIGRVGQHPNVVPLRAYYYSKDEKLLVCDYFSRGNLAMLLHGNKATGRTALDWETRVKIALAAARGIAHIHSTGGPKFTHGNIKSTNVLINQEDSDARVSDYGLAPLMNAPAARSRHPGYRAPEVIETRKHTHKSDVYSFGVLLLEMLTGKQPTQSPGRDDMVDLPKWVQSVVREEWTAEVFDVELLRYQNVEEDMVQMLQIAMACVAKVPEMRPSMDDVVRMVEEVQQSDPENRASSEENKSKDSSNVQTP